MTPAVPKPEIKGIGAITYRCADCNEQISEDPWFSDGRWVAREPIDLNPDVKTYHQEHLPNGR
jgi:hypothetical protein